MSTRIYVVRNAAADIDAETGRPFARLVRAPNPAQAVRHVAADTLTCEVPSQDELVELVAAGVRVEDSGRAARTGAQVEQPPERDPHTMDMLGAPEKAQ